MLVGTSIYRRYYRSLIFPESDLGIFENLCLENRTVDLSNSEPDTTSRKYLLVVLVLSRPDAVDRRNAIRDTWMKKYKAALQNKVLVKFSIGTSRASEELIKNLLNEKATHGDVLLLHDFIESYFNLTKKVLKSFININEHYNFSYALKCDDDSFVVLDVIVKELQQRISKKSYYWGKMINEARVFKEGKFAETEWLLGEKYLPYAIGTGYILSGDLVKNIARNAEDLMLYHNEDVSVSVWISPYNVERWHDDRVCENKRFMYFFCSKITVVLHPVKSAKDFYSLQKLYVKKKPIC